MELSYIKDTSRWKWSFYAN